MEDFFSAIMELILDFFLDKFECIQNPTLRFIAQLTVMILLCALGLAVFFGIYWLFTH